jgi:hypothetical protein
MPRTLLPLPWADRLLQWVQRMLRMSSMPAWQKQVFLWWSWQTFDLEPTYQCCQSLRKQTMSVFCGALSGAAALDESLSGAAAVDGPEPSDTFSGAAAVDEPGPSNPANASASRVRDRKRATMRDTGSSWWSGAGAV